MPRRSTGCQKCRQRKVRCDERKPACQRCSDYSVVCPGYRPAAAKDIHFIDQTSQAAQKSGSELVICHSSREQSLLHNASADDKQHYRPYRWRHQFHGDIIDSSAPATTDNSALHRVQLLSTFLDLYLPKRRDSKMMSHFAYISALPNVDLSAPLLQVTIDTLCLAQLGSLYDDERCLREARARYVRALPMLSKELNQPLARQLPKSDMLTAIVILALCELFDAIAKSDPNGRGWVSHVQGAQLFIKANAPGVISTPFGWLLFHNIRHSSLCMGLVKREAVFFADKQWQRVTKELAQTDPYIALYDLALRVPGVLERADKLAQTTNLYEDFIALAKDICILRHELDDWRRRFHQTSMYRIVDIRSMSEFASLCPDRAFITVFSFSSVQICSQLQLFVVSCLLVDFTFANMYRLHGHIPGIPAVESFTSRSKADIWREMYVCATSYCRSMPYSCEPDTTSSGRIGTFMLRITQSFFEIGGYDTELEWCRAVRRMLEASTVRSPFGKGSREKTEDKVKSDPFEFDVTVQQPEGGAADRLVLGGEYPTMGYIPRLPYGTTGDQTTSNLHHTQSRRWNVPPEIAHAASQVSRNTFGLALSDAISSTSTDSCVGPHGGNWRHQQPAFSAQQTPIFGGKPPSKDARVNGVNLLSDELQPHAVAMCMASDRMLAGYSRPLLSSGRQTDREQAPAAGISRGADTAQADFAPFQGYEEEQRGSAIGMLLGHQDSFVLRPDGMARKGPLGAMCF